MPDMGGFLVELKGMLPKARPKRAPVSTPIPRRPGGKWIPVLGKPTPSVDTAASVLVPQQKMGGESTESTRSTAPPSQAEDTPSRLEGTSVVVSAPVTLEGHQAEPVALGAPDGAPVPAEAVEDIATENMRTARTEVTTGVVHQGTPEAPVAGSSGENMATLRRAPFSILQKETQCQSHTRSPWP